MKSLEAAGVLPRWLYLDDHVHFTATVLSILNCVMNSGQYRISSLRSLLHPETLDLHEQVLLKSTKSCKLS